MMNSILDLVLILLSVFGYYNIFIDAFKLRIDNMILPLLLLFALISYLILKTKHQWIKILLMILLIDLYLLKLPSLLNGLKIIINAVFSKYAFADKAFNIPYIAYTYKDIDYTIGMYLLNLPIILSLVSYYPQKKHLFIAYLPAILYSMVPLLYQYFPDYLYLSCLIIPILTGYITRYTKNDAWILRCITVAILAAFIFTLDFSTRNIEYKHYLNLSDLKMKINNAGHEVNKNIEALPDLVDLTKIDQLTQTKDIELVIESENVGSFKLVGKVYGKYESDTWRYLIDQNEGSLNSTQRRILNLNKEFNVNEMFIYTKMHIPSKDYQPYFTIQYQYPKFQYISYNHIYENDENVLMETHRQELDNYTTLHYQDYTSYPDYYEQLLTTIIEEANLDVNSSPDQLAMQIRDYFNQNYEYTPDIEAMEEGEYFLQNFYDTKQGYCVHYATLATMMLRKCGIMARYVEGYAVNEYSNGSYNVRNEDRHAWIEYYDSMCGWLPFEVTPIYSTTSNVPIYYASTGYQENDEMNEINPEDREDFPIDVPTVTPEKQETEIPEQTQEVDTTQQALNQGYIYIALCCILIVGYVIRKLQFIYYRKQSNNQYILFLYHQLDTLHLTLPKEYQDIAYKAMYSNEMIDDESTKRFAGQYKMILHNHLKLYNAFYYYYYYMH